MTLNVGDLAPNFELPDTELKLRTLEEFKGKKIVLSFIVAFLIVVFMKKIVQLKIFPQDYSQDQIIRNNKQH